MHSGVHPSCLLKVNRYTLREATLLFSFLASLLNVFNYYCRSKFFPLEWFCHPGKQTGSHNTSLFFGNGYNTLKKGSTFTGKNLLLVKQFFPKKQILSFKSESPHSTEKKSIHETGKVVSPERSSLHFKHFSKHKYSRTSMVRTALQP